jgi:hypothetical protein
VGADIEVRFERLDFRYHAQLRQIPSDTGGKREQQDCAFHEYHTSCRVTQLKTQFEKKKSPNFQAAELLFGGSRTFDWWLQNSSFSCVSLYLYLIALLPHLFIFLFVPPWLLRQP